MMQDERRFGDALAVAALAIYVIGELLFRYATLYISFPVIAKLNLLRISEALSMSLAVSAIATRGRVLSNGRAALVATTLALLLISAIFTGDYLLIYAYVLMIAIGGVRLETLCGVYGLALAALIPVVMTLSVLGVTYNKDVIPNSRLVFSYGFGHPNGTGSYLFACCTALGYAFRRRQVWWVPIVLCLVSAAFSYAFLSARAATAMLTALALAIAVGHAMEQKGTGLVSRRLFVTSLTVLPLIMLLSMVIATALYDADNPVFALFNQLLNTRLDLAHKYYLSHGGFTLFGSEYTAVSAYHNGLPWTTVDSGFSRLALTTGVFAYAAIAATYIAAVHMLARENPHILIMVILLLCSAHLMYESVQLNMGIGIMGVFVSAAFVGEKRAPESALPLERSETS